MAKADLQELLRRYVGSPPDLLRDALLEVVPALVREYGNIAATAAAEWYEETRVAAGVVGAHRTVLSDGPSDEQIDGTVRFAAGHLYGDNPEATAGVLNGALQRYVSYSSRDTIRRNARRDSATPRYARVPSGAKTCAWCEMLASRGFVYRTEDTAGEDPKDYHDDCDCQVVVEFDRDKAHIDGYDPDAMYQRYLEARDAAGSGDPNEIAAAMRRLYPDQYTDGVQPKVD